MSRRAFTLVELLITVSIIAVLAAIAVPNFLEAQTRSKVARVKADMRAIRGGLEAYRTDHRAYPATYIGDLRRSTPLRSLTTPVAYVTSVPEDPFGKAPFNFNPNLVFTGYEYVDQATTAVGMASDTYGYIWRSLPTKAYFVHSSGPNRVWDVLPYVTYDPTNGSISTGDITEFGP